MAENTKIAWATHTFKPWSGRGRNSAADWRKPLTWNKRHENFFAQHGYRQRVFCAADVFDDEVDPQWRTDLFGLIRRTPYLDWLLLTKRIRNIGNILPDPSGLDRMHPNVWLGVPICNQAEADSEVPKLLAVPAAKRFLLMEPMLGPVDLTPWLSYCEKLVKHGISRRAGGQHIVCDAHCGISWVIAGADSRPNACPMHPAWPLSLRDQCQHAGVPFWFTQWGEWVPMMGHTEGVPVHGPKFTHPDGTIMGHADKEVAGRVLDGHTWDEVPA